MKIFNKFRLGATIAVRQLQSVTKHASTKELRDGRKLSKWLGNTMSVTALYASIPSALGSSCLQQMA